MPIKLYPEQRKTCFNCHKPNWKIVTYAKTRDYVHVDCKHCGAMAGRPLKKIIKGKEIA